MNAFKGRVHASLHFIGVLIMGAPRKNPPAFAADTIKMLAGLGYEPLGIADYMEVHISLFEDWLKSDPKLSYALSVGREIERQTLHQIVLEAAKNNLPANNNARFLLRTKHGYIEADESKNLSVNVTTPQNVLVICDHGDDAAWSAKCAAQQQALTQSVAPAQLKAPGATQIDAVPSWAPPDYLPVPQVEDAPALPPSPPAVEAPSWHGRC
jgi:hypothetical protein